jgi:hypothetical protein
MRGKRIGAPPQAARASSIISRGRGLWDLGVPATRKNIIAVIKLIAGRYAKIGGSKRKCESM